MDDIILERLAWIDIPLNFTIYIYICIYHICNSKLFVFVSEREVFSFRSTIISNSKVFLSSIRSLIVGNNIGRGS